MKLLLCKRSLQVTNVTKPQHTVNASASRLLGVMNIRVLLLFFLLISVYGFSQNNIGYYELDYVAHPSKPIFPIFILNSNCDTNFIRNKFKDKEYYKFIVSHTLIVLPKDSFQIFDSIVSDKLAKYSSVYSDSTFNKFTVNEYDISNNKLINKDIIFLKGADNFYVELYNVLSQRKFSKKLIFAIQHHITFLEEQWFNKKLINDE